MFGKLLIANRGEIAVRISTVARALGVRTVAVYSEADRDAPHVRAADEAVLIGPAPSRESYLKVEAILAAARATGAEAIHPGYGFLSESASFARAVADAGLVFVGPPPSALERTGDKAKAREAARGAGVPVVPGSDGIVESEEAARAAAARIGYPILVKAAFGGGGIGMQVAQDEAQLAKALRASADRAKSAFGQPAVYLERYFANPRHVEVQVLADAHGNLVHLFERECSIQRRHQKVVEEAPSVRLVKDPALAERMYAAALAAMRAVGYVNAGTVEFLVEGDAFHYIETNARLQVEHPVTELTTGIPLIEWQLRIASGEKLGFTQSEVTRTGAAIECRVYAEDPVKFFPSPGKLTRFAPPLGLEGVRVDAGYEEGGTVTPYYDPMIAKLIAWGATRDEAADRALAGVAAFHVEGVKTNLPLHQRILASPRFRAGDLDTHFLEKL